VIQAVQTLDDVDRTTNLFLNRIREWYGIHFPELNRLLDNPETYLRIILNLGKRTEYTPIKLRKMDISELTATKIVTAAKKSMGANLTDQDLSQIQKLSENVLSFSSLRQTLEKYLEQIMEEVAPNIKVLVGPILGARIIALGGGLLPLAKKPATTIQILGAEKALFRSLKTGSRPPKHGIIFQHSLIHGSERRHRGKIARAIAGKLAIAARVDAFGKRKIGEKLKMELDNKIKEIKEKYSAPKEKHIEKETKKKSRYKRAKKN